MSSGVKPFIYDKIKEHISSNYLKVNSLFGDTKNETERGVSNFAWSWSFFKQVCSILSTGSDLFIQLYSWHGTIICLPLIWNIQVLFDSILKVCQSGKIAVPNTLRTNLFSGNWIGFLANYMQLFQSISICEIKCCREHINPTKCFSLEPKRVILYSNQGGKFDWSHLRLWGENEICKEINGQSFIPVPEIGRAVV